MAWGSVGLVVLGRGVGSWAVQSGLRGRPKGQLGQVVCRPLMAFGFLFCSWAWTNWVWIGFWVWIAVRVTS